MDCVQNEASRFRIQNRLKTKKKKCGVLFTPPCRLQLLSTETQTNTKTRSLCVAKLPPRVNIPLQPFVSPLRPSQEATALSSSRTPTQWIPDAWRKWGNGRALLLSLPQIPKTFNTWSHNQPASLSVRNPGRQLNVEQQRQTDEWH